LCINEGAGPPGAGPNRGNKGKSFKDYSTRLVQQNVTKFDVGREKCDGLIPGA